MIEILCVRSFIRINYRMSFVINDKIKSMDDWILFDEMCTRPSINLINHSAREWELKTHLDNDIGYDDALQIKLDNLLSDIYVVILCSLLHRPVCTCICIAALESIFCLAKAYLNCNWSKWWKTCKVKIIISLNEWRLCFRHNSLHLMERWG